MINHLFLYKGWGSLLILSFTSSFDKCNAALVILAIALFSRYRFSLFRILPQTASWYKSVCPHVGLITSNELEHIVGKEIPALQELQRQNRILLLLLRSLNADQRDEELEYLGHFLSEEN